MSEPKPLASLSSSLLARKGHAKPAMRPQGFANFGFGAPHVHDDLGWNDMGHDHVTRDHGLSGAAEPGGAQIVPIVPGPAAEPVAPRAEPPAVVRQQEELARELTPVVTAPAVTAPVATAPADPVVMDPVPVELVPFELPVERAPRAAAGSKGRAAFTLRLDPDRHLRLRLVCAVSHKSAQAVVIAALDAFLSTESAAAALQAAQFTSQGSVA